MDPRAERAIVRVDETVNELFYTAAQIYELINEKRFLPKGPNVQLDQDGKYRTQTVSVVEPAKDGKPGAGGCCSGCNCGVSSVAAATSHPAPSSQRQQSKPQQQKLEKWSYQPPHQSIGYQASRQSTVAASAFSASAGFVVTESEREQQQSLLEPQPATRAQTNSCLNSEPCGPEDYGPCKALRLPPPQCPQPPKSDTGKRQKKPKPERVCRQEIELNSSPEGSEASEADVDPDLSMKGGKAKVSVKYATSFPQHDSEKQLQIVFKQGREDREFIKNEPVKMALHYEIGQNQMVPGTLDVSSPDSSGWVAVNYTIFKPNGSLLFKLSTLLRGEETQNLEVIAPP